jgi:hypothetical protein
MRVVLSQPATGADTLDVTPASLVQRSIGTGGDPVILRRGVGTVWPESWTDADEFWLTLDADRGDGGVTLKGYRLRTRRNADFGLPVAGGVADTFAEEILLDTNIRVLREGRGGMISAGVLNALREDGHVDVDASTYLTTSELVEIALDALGVTHEGAPASMDLAADGVTAIDAPGPLDWGNVRALTELEALLFRVGYTIAFGIDGVVRVVRLPRAGEPISLSSWITDAAEPWEADVGPGLRGSTILVTSGSTRTTAIQERALDQLEWVAFDERTNAWLNQTDFDTLYPSEIGPEDIARFRAGLTGAQFSPLASKQLAQVYTALALKPGTGDFVGAGDLERCSMFVNIPSEVTAGELAAFRGTPGLVEARVCVDMGGEQFRNFPDDGEDPLVRLEGLKAVQGAGVFILPGDAVYARVDGLLVGRRGDLVPLGVSDLNIVFAHESMTGQPEMDYGLWGFTLDTSGPEPALLPLDAAETLAAYADPEVVKVHQPMLRRLVLRDTVGGLPTDTPLNDTELAAIAGQLAWAKIAEESLASAVITLRGLWTISPGDEGGQINRIVWDHRALRTYLFINQHERPGSEEEMMRRAAGDSIAAGVGGVQLLRSNASLADARLQANADRGGAGPADGSPAANPALRGHERAMAGTRPVKGEGPQPGEGLPKYKETTLITALLRPDPVSIGDNKWEYEWDEVPEHPNAAIPGTAARSSDTHGKARNMCERNNSATGIQGNGEDAANYTATWGMVPIGPCVVELRGPFPMEGDYYWRFFATNVSDGTCPPPEAPE